MIDTIVVSEEDHKEWASYLMHISDQFFIQIVDKNEETVAVMGLGPQKARTDEEKEADKEADRKFWEELEE